LTIIGKLEPENRTDVEKYSFVNRTITDRNQLPEGAIGAVTGNTYSLRKRVRKNEAN
jgi:hypothetical protein